MIRYTSTSQATVSHCPCSLQLGKCSNLRLVQGIFSMLPPSILPNLFASLKDGQISEVINLLANRFGEGDLGKESIGKFISQLNEGGSVAIDLLHGCSLSDLDKSLLVARFETPRLRHISMALDDLAVSVPETLTTCLIYVANLLVPKNKTACVVTAVRNEAPWLIEWIAHYKAMEFDHIIVVYNDSDDGTKEILDHLDRRGDVIAICNEVRAGVSPQKKAFNSALHLLKEVHECTWVAFLDADEFLAALYVPDAPVTDIVNEVANRAGAIDSTQIDAILLHWKWFSSPVQYEWLPGLVTERFRWAMSNDHVKSIVRASIAWSMSRLHFPQLIRDGRVVDSMGEPARLSEQVGPAKYGVAQINHYFAKSFQEFSLKKSRGRGAMGLAGPQREFGNFLWGSQGLEDVGPLASSKKQKRLDEFFADPELVRLAREAERNSRERIARLEQEAELKRVHDDLTRHLKR